MKNLALVILLVLFFVGCETSSEVELRTVTGIVKIIGNEPFAKPALECSGKYYILESTPRNIEVFFKYQHHFFEINYYVCYQTYEGTVIKVASYKLL